MTENQRILRNNLLKRIHLNSEYKTLKENDAWQMWLELRFGVTSSADLSIDELKRALEMLISGEFKKYEPDALGRNIIKNMKIKKAKKSNENKKITPAQYNYIKHLAKRLGFSDEKLMIWVAKQIKILIRLDEQLKRLDMKNAKAVITGLEKMCKFYRK